MKNSIPALLAVTFLLPAVSFAATASATRAPRALLPGGASGPGFAPVAPSVKLAPFRPHRPVGYLTVFTEKGPTTRNMQSMIFRRININALERYLKSMEVYKGKLKDKKAIAAAEKDIAKAKKDLNKEHEGFEKVAQQFPEGARVASVKTKYVPGEKPEDGSFEHAITLEGGKSFKMSSDQLIYMGSGQQKGEKKAKKAKQAKPIPSSPAPSASPVSSVPPKY